MAQQHYILAVALSVASVILSGCLAADEPGMAYDFLGMNNLPRGLLPKGVQSCTIEQPEGMLHVFLEGECNFALTADGGQVYKMRFASTAGGIVKPASIHEVFGVSMQVNFGWHTVSAIDRDGFKLIFLVEGASSALAFPIGSFAASPSCS
ncbi:hypothetical protein EJB05_42145, partial [Eragrostis curvula]